jgi:hypothetical protein
MEKAAMIIPRFTAEASLDVSRGCYRSCALAAAASPDRVLPAFPWDPPQITVAYRPPSFPFGPGFPGTLIVTGDNFAPDVDVTIRASNCGEGGVGVGADAHTTKSFDYCPHPWDCRRYFGGHFSASVSCFCGGISNVEARDTAGNAATGVANLPC